MASSPNDVAELVGGNVFDLIVCCWPQPLTVVGALKQRLSEAAAKAPVVFYDPQNVLDRSSLAGTKLAACVVIPQTPPEELVKLLARECTVRYHAPAAPTWKRLLVGDSAPMQVIVDIIELVAPRRATILITGETGTGKDVVARAVHLASPRSAAPFVAVNCGAIPDTLIESELFGHTKGAFTGAVQSQSGRFEEADGGTLFLDEIAEIPIELQPKLLRAIQEREIRRVGSSESSRVDIRLMAATNQDLLGAVRQRKFRDDLYYRINVVSIHVPPLRERLSDIPALADHFLEKICRQEEIEPKRIGSDVMDHLMSYPWPGNVRELEHCIEKAAAISSDRKWLGIADFPLTSAQPNPFLSSLQLPGEGIDFEQTIENLQRHLLIQALQRSSGNKARAAQMLGMKRTTLQSKVKVLSAVL